MYREPSPQRTVSLEGEGKINFILGIVCVFLRTVNRKILFYWRNLLQLSTNKLSNYQSNSTVYLLRLSFNYILNNISTSTLSFI